jgi:DNA primase
VIAVQCTALTGSGEKRAVVPLRWTIGPIKGGAIRLADRKDGKTIVLIEGIEDGLSVLETSLDLVPWAICGAENAANVELPPSASIILAFDGDPAGKKATLEAGMKLWLEEREVRVASVPDGQDLNDILQSDSEID